MKLPACAAALLVLAALASDLGGEICLSAGFPAPPPDEDITSCDTHAIDVQQHLPGDPFDQLPYFDAYSWRVLAAVLCQVDPQHRGLPDPQAPHGRDGRRVFETFKSAWEVFHNAPSSADPDVYGDEAYNPCTKSNPKPGDLVLASSSKFIDTWEVGQSGDKIAPLPAQNGKYVHYLSQFNRDSFCNLRKMLQQNSHSPIDFPPGSINIKTAWIETDGLRTSGFLERTAWLPKPGAAPGECRQSTVGLVGLHIVHKTKTQKFWLWSSFEHNWNVPVRNICPLPSGPYSFHDDLCGRDHRMPLTRTFQLNDPESDAPPVIKNVERRQPIAASTGATNQDFQKKFGDSEWRNYELVLTQWSTKGLGTDPANTFPGKPVSTNFTNSVMETFLQTDINYGCMECHSRSHYDMVWAPDIEPLDRRLSSLKLLKTLTRRTHMIR